MNKTQKYFLGTALGISLVLNLVSISLLNSYSDRFNAIESKVNRISSSIVSVNSNISNIKQQIKDETKDKTQNDIMTPSELAVYLEINIEQIYKLVIDNPDSKFPHIKNNGEVRFSKKAIDEYMLKGNNSLE